MFHLIGIWLAVTAASEATGFLFHLLLDKGKQDDSARETDLAFQGGMCFRLICILKTLSVVDLPGSCFFFVLRN